VTEPTSPGAMSLAFLPGPAIDRETAAGWERWRLTRHRFVPAPRLDWADYQRLKPREHRLHDLHRAVTHANLPFQETPMSAAVAEVMRARIQTNALKHKPTTRAGLIISGGGYQGKTETACEVAAAFEDDWLALHGQHNPQAIPGTRDLHAPVAYVQTPVTATPKMTCQAILDFYGADHKNMTLNQLIRAVRASLYDHGTKVLLLDDITRLKLHREADQDALDLIRSLMSMSVTLVLIGVGVRQSGLLREGRQDPRTGQWVFPPPKRARGRAGTMRPPSRPSGALTWSTSTRSATTPPAASRPGWPISPGSSSTCGCSTPSQACSPTEPCPNTYSAELTASSACWSGYWRTAARARSKPARSALPLSCSTASRSISATCPVGTQQPARSRRSHPVLPLR
jgi:hypothetical protein